MIAKRGERKRRRRKEPVNVQLTVKVNFSDAAEDAVTFINHRRIPMIGSVFAYRDRILRAFAVLLVKGGLSRPTIVRRLLWGSR